jgi:hypothetical protein
MHRTILAYTGRLRVGQPHYNALQDLHDALRKTIKTVTGKDAPWASIKPGFMSQLPRDDTGAGSSG